MKFKVLIFLLPISLILGAISSSAQPTDNATSKINDIKRDTTYIYAEATTKIKDDAINDAKAILEVNINQWLSSIWRDGSSPTIAIAKLDKELSEIQTTRGSFFRAFVYVKKSSIMTIESDSCIIMCGQSEPLAEEQDGITAVPVVVNLSDANTLNNMQPESKYQPTAFEKSMLEVGRFAEIKCYINKLKSENRILDYGKYQTIPSSGECYIFIYDKKGNIPACLHRISMKYVNVEDGSDDDIKNYDGCGAFWFSLK